MTKAISRRSFLKGACATAGGLAASGMVLPQATEAATGEELCTLFDLEKCIGCEECVSACRKQWQETVPNPVKPIPEMFPKRVPVQDWSQKKDVQDRLTPYNFLYVEMLEIEHKNQTLELNVPRRCMHCNNPPCTNLCPFGAGRIEKNGVVHIDKDLCLGGAKCKTVCPWHIPQRQSGVGLYLNLLPRFAGNGVMFKCHRCLPLVKKGEKPRCIEVCPEDVQTIGMRQEILAKAILLAKKKAKADGAKEENYGEYIYGLKENGGTSTIYVSPIPFKKVNEALIAQHKELASQERKEAKQKGEKPEKGNLGRPHMAKVENSMENPENLGWALLAAPVAGFLAGVGKLAKKAQNVQDKGGQS